MEISTRTGMLMSPISRVCNVDSGTNEWMEDGEAVSTLLAEAGEMV